MRKLATIVLFCTLPIPVLSVAEAAPCEYTGKNHRVLSKKLRRIGFTLCKEHFPKGTLAHEAVERGLADLNKVQNSTVRFYIAGYDDHKLYKDAVKKDKTFRLDIVKAPEGKGGFAGRCISRSGKKGIHEFDVVFNKRVRWNFGFPKAWKKKYKRPFLTTVMLHEICHGLGFAHSHKLTKDISIMGAGTGKWMGQLGFGIKPWDHGHIRYHYGDSKTKGKADLVLSNYETIKTGKGAPLELTTGLSSTEIKRGEQLTVSWTRFNTGFATKKPYKMKIVLAAKGQKLKQGAVLKEWTQTAIVAESSTVSETMIVKVPKAIRPGNYRVIVVIDSREAIKEQRKDNNYLVIHKTLFVTAKKRRMASK